MKINKKQATLAYIQCNGNVPEAFVMYIYKNGCNGIKCKKCMLNSSCDRHPQHARLNALTVLKEAYKIRESISCSVRPQ